MKAFVKPLTLFSILFFLAACGGGGSLERDSDSGSSGGGTGSGGGTSDPEYSVSVQIVDQNSESNKNLTEDNPLRIIATVTDENGEPVTDTLVTFSLSDPDLAVFANGNGKKSTNSNGVAELGIAAGTLAGDGQITATLPSGEFGTATFSSTGTTQIGEQPATLELYASAVQLASSGSEQVELIALVKNEQSVLMENVDVSFSANADAGVEIQLTQPLTKADGTARALLSTQNDASNRVVEVTARTGILTKKVKIAVSGTEVTINGTRSMILDGQADLILRVQNSDGVAIPNQTVTVSAENGTLATDSVVTGSDGQASVSYRANASGSDTITASSLNASNTFSITVQADQFRFSTVPATEVPLGLKVSLEVEWDKNKVPVNEGEVSFTASRGEIITAMPVNPDAQGRASFTIRSDNAGLSSITATGHDNLGNEVTASTEIEFIATTPYVLHADATPDLIGPNGQKSTITAIVRDENGNLVKNAVIAFNVDDVSTGSIAPSQATTDSNGIASTIFSSASVTSEAAVKITAQVNGNIAISDEVNLTVGKRAFDVAIGTGNIINKPDNATYMKEFAVFVTDSVGQPVEAVDLTASSTPVKYADDGIFYKGFYSWNGEIWVRNITATCPNEDILDNGILDSDEDTNEDNFLTPGIVGSVRFAGDAKTDENGQAMIELRYPQSYAGWYEASIRVFAQSTGSEASAEMKYLFSLASEDIANENAKPANSPFGSSTSCEDIL